MEKGGDLCGGKPSLSNGPKAEETSSLYQVSLTTSVSEGI